MKTIKEIRELSGMSRAEFSRTYGIPIRSLENWESGRTKCPAYLHDLLLRAVVEDKHVESLACYDKNVLHEIGYCYCALLHVMNKDGKNPYPLADICPLKYFTIVYMQASRIGIPEHINERIGQIMNYMNPDEWSDIMNSPVPMNKRPFFTFGMLEYERDYQ